MTKTYTTTKTDKSDGVFYEYIPLSDIMKDLPDNSDTVVVNKDHVQGHSHQVVTMVDDIEVKVGKT